MYILLSIALLPLTLLGIWLEVVATTDWQGLLEQPWERQGEITLAIMRCSGIAVTAFMAVRSIVFLILILLSRHQLNVLCRHAGTQDASYDILGCSVHSRMHVVAILAVSVCFFVTSWSSLGFLSVQAVKSLAERDAAWESRRLSAYTDQLSVINSNLAAKQAELNGVKSHRSIVELKADIKAKQDDRKKVPEALAAELRRAEASQILRQEVSKLEMQLTEMQDKLKQQLRGNAGAYQAAGATMQEAIVRSRLEERLLPAFALILLVALMETAATVARRRAAYNKRMAMKPRSSGGAPADNTPPPRPSGVKMFTEWADEELMSDPFAFMTTTDVINLYLASIGSKPMSGPPNRKLGTAFRLWREKNDIQERRPGGNRGWGIARRP
jgi:hypothetical protein